MEAGHELKMVSVRLVDEPPLLGSKKVKTVQDAAEVMAKELSGCDRELFCILNLRTNGQVINANIVAMGTLNSSLVCPREIFKSSILSNAAHVVLLHNHPSGDPAPSQEDIIVTKKLQLCGDMIGIPVVDHIITNCYGVTRHFIVDAKSILFSQLHPY